MTLEIVSGDDDFGSSSVEVQSESSAQSSSISPLLGAGIANYEMKIMASASARTLVFSQSLFGVATSLA